MATHLSELKITKLSPQKFLHIVGTAVLSLCTLTAQAAGPTYSFLNTFDTATVDGYYTDWQPLTGNTHVPMYRAGNATKDVLSDLYLRYDCSSGTIFGLVLKTKPNHSVVGNAWIKIYELGNSPRVQESDNPPNGVQPEFSWIGPAGSVQPNTQGYEASFSLAPGSYTLEAHLNIDDGTGSQTSSSGRSGDEVHLNITCPTESLGVNKTANPFYTEKYDWTLTKTVDPASHTMFIGDAAQPSTYTVTVDQTITPTGQKVQGQITIANNTASKTAKIANVVDTITPGNIPVAVNCGVTFPYTLPAGQTLTCSYAQTLASAFNGTNEVIVLPANGSELKGGRATANFAFSASTPKETTGYPTVDVVDNKEGTLQTGLSGDQTFTYTHDFSCSTNQNDYDTNGRYQETYDNIAQIQKTENGNTTVIASDDASVVKTCYKPSVTKDAHPSKTETLDWTLDKAVDKTALVMNAGESSIVHYTVAVDTEVTNTAYAVNGTITVTNPHPTQSITVPVTDILTGGIHATVDCGGSANLTVGAGSSATCTYSADLPNSDTRTNTAIATFNGIDFEGTATVNFSGVVPTVVGPSPSPATVTDTNTPADSPWTTSGPNSWTYDKTLTCSTDAADYQNGGHYSFDHPNTAAITDTSLTDTVTVKVDCYAPTVSKTAAPAINRTLDWTLEKTVTPDHLAMNIGAPGEPVHYTVTVGTEPIADQTKYSVTGTITVTNPNPTQPMTVAIADNLPGSTNMVLDCDGGLNPTIPAGGQVNCTYSADLPDDSPRTNTATATLNGLVMPGTATVNFSGVTPTDTGPTPSPATVTDTNTPAGSPWTTSAPSSWTYDVTLTCSKEDKSKYDAQGHYSFTHPNTAAIEGTDKSVSRNVTVDCYAPKVSKNATPTFIRTYQWSIDKIANITSSDISLGVGLTYSYTYDIITNVTGHNDTEVKVSGDITVQNPNPEDVMDVSVADNLPGATVTLNCGGALSVPMGGSLPCHYEASLADNSTGSNFVNTATVMLNDVLFEATAPVNFGSPTTEIDECITVTDEIGASYWSAGMPTGVVPIGTTCVNNGMSKTFTYGPVTAGPYGQSYNCQLPNNPAGWIDNTATFTANDNSNNTGTATEHVPVCVPAGGCTLTQGYWKTHSIYGKAPSSTRWSGYAPTNVAGVVDSSKTVNLATEVTFFKSNLSYYQVLWTVPSGGNAYYLLAHQWIASYLNWINKASMPGDVQNAFNQAWTLLATYAPNQVSGNVAKQFKQLYPILDNYNQGLVGPGHCSDDSILFGVGGN